MKFDVVIGNPPYNKGMDLDFVDLGYKNIEQIYSNDNTSQMANHSR